MDTIKEILHASTTSSLWTRTAAVFLSPSVQIAQGTNWSRERRRSWADPGGNAADEVFVIDTIFAALFEGTYATFAHDREGTADLSSNLLLVIVLETTGDNDDFAEDV